MGFGFGFRLVDIDYGIAYVLSVGFVLFVLFVLFVFLKYPVKFYVFLHS